MGRGGAHLQALAVPELEMGLYGAGRGVGQQQRAPLRSGFLASKLDVDLKSTEPLAFSIGGSAEVSQLHTLDTLKNRDFVKWQKLTLDGLAYKHGDSLVIQSVSFEQPYARFMPLLRRERCAR